MAEIDPAILMGVTAEFQLGLEACLGLTERLRDGDKTVSGRNEERLRQIRRHADALPRAVGRLVTGPRLVALTDLATTDLDANAVADMVTRVRPNGGPHGGAA